MKKYENFCKALQNLKDIYDYQPPYDNVVTAGLTGLYEICFELAWKAMKEFLTNQGFEECRSGSPKQIIKVAYKAGIRAARVPVIDLFCGDEMSPGQLIGRLGLGTLARIARHKAHKRGMKTPDTFAGIVAGEAVSEKYLREMTESMPEGTTEVMLHPGTDNHVLVPACEWDHDFEEELRAVTSKATMQLLKDRNIEIGNFRDLYDLGNVNS